MKDYTKDTTTKMTSGMFSSRTEEWETPQYVYDWLHSMFHFTLDPCCTIKNQKCDKGFAIDNGYDGLKESWENEFVFMNPPYGREIYKWMQKAFVAIRELSPAHLIVCLVHARTDTRWFHDFAMKANEIWFIKGRLKFGDGKQSAPFPSCVVIFQREKISVPIIKGKTVPTYKDILFDMPRKNNA